MDSEHLQARDKGGLIQKIKTMPRWLKWASGVVAVLCVAAAVIIPRGESEAMPVDTVIIGKQDIKRTVVSSGNLEPAVKQEFFTPVDSTLMELEVEVGDRVEKGQFLGRLDTLELGRLYEEAKARLAGKEAALAGAKAVDDRLALEHARARYEQAQNHLERMVYLHGQGAVTIEELESAEVEFAGAEAAYREAAVRVQEGAAAKEIASLQAQVDLAAQEVAQARERLELAEFTAAGDGVVLFVGAEKGNRVLEGTRLLVVGSDDRLEVVAGINEIDAGSIQKGQEVKVTCAALPGEEYKGEVTRVAAAAVTRESSSGSMVAVPVTVKLEENTGGLKPGYTVDLEITIMEKEDVLTVPFEALLNRDGEKIAYVVEDGVARERRVQTQPGNELYDIVTAGLNEGDRVIINPPLNISDGQKVMAIPAGGQG